MKRTSEIKTFNFLPGIFSSRWKGMVKEGSRASIPPDAFHNLQNVRHRKNALVPRGGQSKLAAAAFTNELSGIFDPSSGQQGGGGWAGGVSMATDYLPPVDEAPEEVILEILQLHSWDHGTPPAHDPPPLTARIQSGPLFSGIATPSSLIASYDVNAFSAFFVKDREAYVTLSEANAGSATWAVVKFTREAEPVLVKAIAMPGATFVQGTDIWYSADEDRFYTLSYDDPGNTYELLRWEAGGTFGSSSDLSAGVPVHVGSAAPARLLGIGSELLVFHAEQGFLKWSAASGWGTVSMPAGYTPASPGGFVEHLGGARIGEKLYFIFTGLSSGNPLKVMTFTEGASAFVEVAEIDVELFDPWVSVATDPPITDGTMLYALAYEVEGVGAAVISSGDGGLSWGILKSGNNSEFGALAMLGDDVVSVRSADIKRNANSWVAEANGLNMGGGLNLAITL